MDLNYIAAFAECDSDATAWFALGVSIVTFAWLVWSEFTGYRRRQADEYWYRTVFSPHCIEPLVELLNAHLESLKGIDPDVSTSVETKEVYECFSSKKASVISKLWISRLFCDRFYDEACEKLDSIEDGLATRFGKWSLKPGGRDVDLDNLRSEAITAITGLLARASKINLRKFAKSGS